MPSTGIFLLFVFATLVGYLHVVLAVNFDPFEILRQMSLPRFSQSWSRGRSTIVECTGTSRRTFSGLRADERRHA